MASKPINFSVHNLIVDSATFDAELFTGIPNEDLEKFDVTRREDRTTETLQVKKVIKNKISDRFTSIYFLQGSKYPYSETVVDENLEETQNPRDPNQIEMDDQFFALVDITNQRVYLSDARKKHVIAKWLEEKTAKSIVIKSILNENQFVEKLKTVNAISFTLVPNLYNSSSEGVLGQTLVEDIYGYGADRAKLELQYSNTNVTTTIKQKIRDVLGRRSEFETITVVGRDEEDFESVFNLDEIVSKISISVNMDSDSKLVSPDEVFSTLISSIR